MKNFIVLVEGFEIGIINEEELELLKLTNTKDIVVKQIIQSNISNVLLKIKNKIPFYSFSYNYSSQKYCYEQIQDLKKINIDYVGEIYDSNDYSHILYSNFIPTTQDLEKEKRKFEEHINFVIKSEKSENIEEYFKVNSTPRVVIQEFSLK